MTAANRPKHHDELIPLYGQLVYRIDNLLKPFADAPKALDFPQKHTSVEIAILSRLAQCPASLTSLNSHIDRITATLKRANADLRSLLSGQSHDLVSQTVIPRESFRMNEKFEKIQRRIAVIRSAILTFEKENQQLNAITPSIPKSTSPSLLALREFVDNEWLRVSELEYDLQTLRKENALVLSREKGQIDALEQSVEAIANDVKLLEHRLDVLGKARAPAAPLRARLALKRVNVPQNKARKHTPRQRILLRKPKPKPREKRSMPIAEPSPRFIPVRIAHLWSTDEEPYVGSFMSNGSVSDELAFDDDEIDVGSGIYDFGDVPIDQLEMIQRAVHESDLDEFEMPVIVPMSPVEKSFRRRFSAADQADAGRGGAEGTKESPRRGRGRHSCGRVTHLDRVSGELVGVSGDPISASEGENEEEEEDVGRKRYGSFGFMDQIPSFSEENSEYSSAEDGVAELVDVDEVSEVLMEGGQSSSEQTEYCRDVRSATGYRGDLDAFPSSNEGDLGSGESEQGEMGAVATTENTVRRRKSRRFYAIETCVVTSQSPK